MFKIYEKLSFLEKIKFKVAFIILTLVIMLVSATSMVNRFFSTNPRPYISYSLPKIKSDKKVVTTNVEAGAYIVNFNKFDTMKNNFIVRAVFWFKFNPSLVSRSSIENFSFEMGEIIYRSEPFIKSLPNNDLFVRYDVLVKFSSNLDHRYFPLNGHTIFLVLNNNSVSADEIRFDVPDHNLVVFDGVYIDDWISEGSHVYTGYHELNLGNGNTTQPRIIFALDFKRAGFRKLLIIFVPILIFLLLGLVSLVLEIDTYATLAVSIVSSSLTGMLAYMFVIQRLSPSIGYFSVIDYIFNTVLVCIFISFVTILTHISINKKYKRLVSIVRTVIFYMVQMVVLYVWSSLLSF